MAKKTVITKKKEAVKEVEVMLSDKTKIVVRLSEFEGKNRVDIREHVETAKYTGYTKKGINILTNNLESLHSAIGTILETIKAENLINPEDVE